MITGRVLIVDDDRDLAESFGDYLELDGHEVVIASSARAGIEAALAADFDQIIIDVGLPDLDGIATARRILEARPQARILMVTGYCASETDAPAPSGESMEVLTKPVDPDLLSARVAAAVASRADETR